MRTASGFTLIEIAIVLAVTALLATFALPAMERRMTAARRADATVALERVQLAQERHRALHGLYSADASALGISLRSPEGLYTLELRTETADSYAAVALPSEGSAQRDDVECTEISLQVIQGFATPGPSRRCWNR
ncbi:MAG: prepilin-type N-terminal cleavage/methylation domain-containing protein [Burkholderiaceae bacterium]|nr:prepilin-type N-terminal cleavage/methylation domain-containing protein [Rhodoferax sp.]MCP5285303.1 prepilin-type N-terminal cleavage/methylation domain-containing protein [Burkholderiaceae bacterium]